MLGRFTAFDSREQLWSLLDLLDARPALKRSIVIGAPTFVVALTLGVLGYHHWARGNSIRIAREWLKAGRLDRAGVAVQDALETEPGKPESWRLASELAWKMGNRTASVDYAKQAAAVGRYQADDVLAWAEASILAGDVEQAQQAEMFLDERFARASPRALRVAGEIARRGLHFADARDRFEAALRADIMANTHVLAIDEIPLGIVCLQTGSAEDRPRGQAFLAKWTSDSYWGVVALRALLADATTHRDREAVVRWAEELRMHPRCTLGDVPVCLQALADTDPERYQGILAPLEDKGRSDPTKAALLLGWLTEIGQGAEAVRWGESLDPAAARKPPIAQGIAEALRATRRWADLQAWSNGADWGRELGFLGYAYGMAAARKLGDGPKADSSWHSLYDDGRISPSHALFAGDSLYAWGYPKEAAALLWAAAERQDLRYQALGTLARLYQVQRDSLGQYRVFAELNAMRSTNRDIANNYVYFAAITGMGNLVKVAHLAEDNFAHEPGNVIYRSTYAFVLVWSGQANQALKVLEPVSNDWKKSPAIAFAYGAALAHLGRKSEAREVFASLDPGYVDSAEGDWIRAALR